MSQAGARAGKWMLALAWLIGMALATYWFARIESRAQNPNQQPASFSQEGVIEVHLKQNAQHHFLASGSINTQAVEFLLDTGASEVSISAALAKRLGLTQGEAVRLHTANGQSVGYRTELAELRLGQIALHNVRALIVPNLTDAHVLLGMSALKHLEFTQRDGTLVLRHYPNQ